MNKDFNKMFIDIRDYLEKKIYFNFFIGGRGIGKTYSTIDTILHDFEFPIYVRYSNSELEKAVDNEDPENNEFFKIDPDIRFKLINPGFYGIYKNDVLRGYACSLQTFYKIRGVNFEKADVLFIDEFIPEINARRVLKDPSSAVFNMIETINRNREFFGKEPIQCIFCANSNNIYNEIFTSLEIVKDLELTLNSGQEIFKDPERMLQVVILKSKKEFLERKKETALYKLTKGTNFYKMALENEFAYNDFDFVIRNMNLVGFIPLFQINHILIWKKKNEDYYCCKYTTKPQAQVIQLRNDIDKKYINKLYRDRFFTAILNKRMFFDSYEIKKQIFDIFDIKC